MQTGTTEPTAAWRSRLEAFRSLAERHQAVFWTLHSIWAMTWGVFIMAVGAKREGLLRWGLASIGIVWATSLLLPAFLRTSWLPEDQKPIARKLVLWFQKWQLQGLAFFILPLYHRSATYPSRNVVFMALLALAALAATIDVLYDDVVTPRPWLLGVFLAFIAFASVNLMLPMVWLVGGRTNLVVSAGLATAVFVSFWARQEAPMRPRRAWEVVSVALLFLLVVTVGRPFVPPAPLRLVSARFGMALAEGGLDVASPLASVTPAGQTRLQVVAAVQAPAGLAEGVRHLWTVDGTQVAESRLIDLTGGRVQGFRSQSSATFGRLTAGQRVRVEVETAWGQLIGRSEIAVR